MKLALYIVATVIISGAHIVGAFAAKSKQLEVKSPFEAFTKSTLLKSSRAEPLPEQKARPVSSKNVNPIATVSGRIATAHKKWGVDNATPNEYFEEHYWADSRIHTLGNMGILGAVSELMLLVLALTPVAFS